MYYTRCEADMCDATADIQYGDGWNSGEVRACNKK